jgi:hypothetical protein
MDCFENHSSTDFSSLSNLQTSVILRIKIVPVTQWATARRTKRLQLSASESVRVRGVFLPLGSYELSAVAKAPFGLILLFLSIWHRSAIKASAHN